MFNKHTKAVSSLIIVALFFTNTCYGYNLPKNTKSKDNTLRPQVTASRNRTEIERSLKTSSSGQQDKPAKKLKHTPITRWSIKNGGKMYAYAGFSMPQFYYDSNNLSYKEEELARAEAVHTRRGVSIFDESHMTLIDVKGPKAAEFIDTIACPNVDKDDNVRPFNNKDIQYRHILNIEALNIDDIEVIKISEDYFRLVVNAGNAKEVKEWLEKDAPVGNLRKGTKITDLRDSKTTKDRRIILAVQGTNGSQEILQKLVKGFDLKELDYFKSDFVVMDIDGKEIEVLIQRTGYTGEDGFEVHIHPDHALAFWEKVIELGAKPSGLMARNILRTEAGFPLQSNELAGDKGAMAFEYKYGFVLSLTENGPDYIGKKAAIEKSKTSTKRLVGIRVLGREIDSVDNVGRKPKDKDKIFDTEGKEIGHITSVVFSPNLNACIGLAYIDKENAKIGTKLGSYNYRLKVVKAPFINHVISDRGMDEKETSKFYLPTDDPDRRNKLAFVNEQFRLGLDLENMSTDDAIDALFGPLQEYFIEKGSLGLGEPITSRRELFRLFYKISLKNKQDMTSFKGGGYYDEPGSDLAAHLVTLLGFLTSYTPYIAESSQGNTTLMFLYQSLMAMFLDMDVVNASLYEGSSSLSEGVRMAIRATGRKKVIVLGDINPRHKKVLGTQMKNMGIEPVFIFQNKSRSLDLETLEKEIDEDTATVIVQQPNFLGEIASYFSLDKIRNMATAKGAKFHIHSNDPMVFAMLKPPGRYGADIVTAEGQVFVGAPYSGGNNLGIIACKRELINFMPGRMVVQTKDVDGKTAFALGLSKGEQHYARKDANCNICTNVALNALCCALFFLEHGNGGLEKMAEGAHEQAAAFAHVMSGRLKIPGFRVFNKSVFFREVIIESPIPADELQKRLADEFNIDAGIDISKDFPQLGKNLIQFSFTAKHTNDDIIRLDDALRKISKDLGCKDEKEEISTVAMPIDELMQRGNAAHFSGLDQEKYGLQIPFILEEVLRGIISDLNKLNYNPRQQKIILGSCTMMTNPLINEIIAMLPGFSELSPYRRPEDMQGTLQIIYELCEYIRKLTGMDFASVNPAAGAHGEYTGLTAIHRYQESRGQGHRNIVLVTDSSHGTNAASSAMANAIVIEIKTNPKTGRLDLADLSRVVNENKGNISAIMLTEPNTLGLFEDLEGAAKLVLADGGEVYWDGANFNSVIGRVLIAELGVTIGQGNSHKTLAGPHGGGGPGAGFVFCKKHLAPFMPNPRVALNADGSYGIENAEAGIDIGSFFGNTPNHVRAYAYLKALGEEGLRQASGDAVLNANYLLGKLMDHEEFIIPCDLDERGRPRLRMHEFVVLLSKIKEDTGVGPMDFAMRLQDFGMQPTVLFPRIKDVVEDPLMLEPTQSLTTKELDFIADTMIAVMRECYEKADFVKASPHNTPIGSERKFSRIDTHSEPTTAIVKAAPEQIGAILGLGDLSFDAPKEVSTTIEYEEPFEGWEADKEKNIIKGVMWYRVVELGNKEFAVVGLTEEATGEGGTFDDISSVNEFREVSSEFDVGDWLIQVEISKTAVDIESEIKGKVVKVNEYLSQAPATINNDPLNKGWLYLLELPKASSAGETRREGFEIIVQSGLGDGIGRADEYKDDDYEREGAEVKATREEVWSNAHIVIKVKEPLVEGEVDEFELMKGMAKPEPGKLVIGVVKEIKPYEGRAALLPDGVEELINFAIEINFAETYKGISDISKTLFTYYHFADSRELTEKVMGTGGNAVALEAIEGDPYTAPLFTNEEWIVDSKEEPGEPGRVVVPNTVKVHKEGLGTTLTCLDGMSIVAGVEATLDGVVFLDEGKVKIVGEEIKVEDGWADYVLNSYPDSPNMKALSGKTTLITGSGAAGLSSLWQARRLGSKVVISDLKHNLTSLSDILSSEYGRSTVTICDSKGDINKLLEDHDIVIIDGEDDNLIEKALIPSSLIIGAALVPKGKGKAPKTIKGDIIKRVCDEYPMRRLFVDISKDQGGNFDFVDIDGKLRSEVDFTYHHDPVRLGYEDTIYYLVANMPGRPGVIAKASSKMLQASRLPHLKNMIKNGLVGAARKDPGLKAGLSVVRGELTDETVANTEGFDLTWTPVDKALRKIRAVSAKKIMSTHTLAKEIDTAA
ncbi:MAG: glycine cleavage T C-terminal barrel domain-containing protein [Candidatus Omnitrophota bacterium]